MTTRRSGEIINATLMEVFITLCFLVLLLLQEAEDRAASVQRALSTERESFRQLTLAKATADERVSVQDQKIVELEDRWLSEHPGDCHLPSVPVKVLDAEVQQSGDIRVKVLAAIEGYAAGSVVTLSPAEFHQYFAPVWQYSKRNRCRFIASVSNSPDVPLETYKRANGAIATIFRVVWR
jgi:isopentenyl diphosphate isomerase/L-lactate dehydrogenase-like FMN-dependent dehydrogenase